MKRSFRIFFGALIGAELLGSLGFLPKAADFTWFGLMLTALAAWVLLERLEAPLWIWGFSILMLFFDAASALFVLYSKISWWDHPMHFLGGAVIAAGGYEVFSRLLRETRRHIRAPKAVLAVSIFMLVVTIGFLYEFLEYVIDHYYFGYEKTLVSGPNSILDQLWNIVGGVAMFLVLEARSAWARRPKMLKVRTAYAKGIKNPA